MLRIASVRSLDRRLWTSSAAVEVVESEVETKALEVEVGPVVGQGLVACAWGALSLGCAGGRRPWRGPALWCLGLASWWHEWGVGLGRPPWVPPKTLRIFNISIQKHHKHLMFWGVHFDTPQTHNGFSTFLTLRTSRNLKIVQCSTVLHHFSSPGAPGPRPGIQNQRILYENQCLEAV